MADIKTTLISGLTATTTVADTDNLIVGGADAKKITWATIISLIKTKLGIGSYSSLTTTSKELVGAVNELNSNISSALQVISVIGSVTSVSKGEFSVEVSIAGVPSGYTVVGLLSWGIGNRNPDLNATTVTYDSSTITILGYNNSSYALNLTPTFNVLLCKSGLKA